MLEIARTEEYATILHEVSEGCEAQAEIVVGAARAGDFPTIRYEAGVFAGMTQVLRILEERAKGE